MPPNMKPLMRVARIQSGLSRNLQIQRTFASGGPLPGGTPGESSVQAMPIGPYYESMLKKPQPIPKTKPEEPPVSSPKSPRSSSKKAAQKAAKEDASSSSSSGTIKTTSSVTTNTVPPQPTSEPSTAQEKARIIFGSRLAGPAEQRADRLQSIRDRSVRVAGVLVPPRPEEPDNCCMSGCVNCVWDRYRDDMEEWAAASARAEEALQAERARGRESVVDVDAAAGEASVSAALSSVDDDGGGSETNWGTEQEMAKRKKTDRPKIAKDLWDDDLYTNIPVGIREFMKHEKKLKKKHEEEGTFGA
ncbi:oxidoreductase-like protein [Xylaria flabelliformis]|nr:oxidoreductase-like protein [Xylaria flabelliformis]